MSMVFVVDFRSAVMSSPDEKVAASISEEPEDAGNDAKKPEVKSATANIYRSLVLHLL